MPTLYEAQPHSCRAPLPRREVKPRGRNAAIIRRVLAYDPSPAYARIAATLDPFSRIQVRKNLSLAQLFPKKNDGFCDCSCGIALTGRQRRWAHSDCAETAWWIYAVIAGRRRETGACLRAYWGTACAVCGDAPQKLKPRRKRMVSAIEWDHTVPVHRGGGACWLGNWQPMCKGCHKEKTGRDRRQRQEALGSAGACA